MVDPRLEFGDSQIQVGRQNILEIFRHKRKLRVKNKGNWQTIADAEGSMVIWGGLFHKIFFMTVQLAQTCIGVLTLLGLYEIVESKLK